MSDPIQTICNSIGCSIEEAEKAYKQTGDITEAIDLLFVKPPCSSDKYLISKPKIISEEQEAFNNLREAMEKIDNEITSLSRPLRGAEDAKLDLHVETVQQNNCSQICLLPSQEVEVEIPEIVYPSQSELTCGSQ